MGSDRQDFLERKEARLRRMQQDAAASRSPSKGGKGQSSPAPRAQKPAMPGRKAAEASFAGAARAKPGAPAPAEKPGQKAKPARLQDAKRANPPAEQQELVLLGGLAGRRSAAWREQQAGAQPASSDPKPSLLARLIVWCTVAICGLLILATLGEVWTVHQLHQQVNASQQAANQLTNQNRALATQIAQLQQPETIEYEARQLGYIYPGDQPVVVVTTQPTPAATRQPASSAKNGWGFWPDWLKLFFGG